MGRPGVGHFRAIPGDSCVKSLGLARLPGVANWKSLVPYSRNFNTGGNRHRREVETGRAPSLEKTVTVGARQGQQ